MDRRAGAATELLRRPDGARAHACAPPQPTCPHPPHTRTCTPTAVFLHPHPTHTWRHHCAAARPTPTLCTHACTPTAHAPSPTLPAPVCSRLPPPRPHPELGLAVVLLAALSQHRHAHRHLGHGLFGCPHQHDLDDSALVDVGVKCGLPLGVHGGLLLHQRLPALCNTARQRSGRGPSLLPSPGPHSLQPPRLPSFPLPPP